MTTTPQTSAPPISATAPDEQIITMAGLHRRFGSGEHAVTAVNGLDLQIGRGEIVALLGPNGAGKTTTIDMLLGLTSPTSGSVQVFGRRPAEAAASGRMSAVLQTGGLLEDLTVSETVNLIAALHGRDAVRRVPETIRRTGLDRLKSRRISKCSGGEQQRVKFALALLTDPDILVLDEPTAGMDVTARHEFWNTMREGADAGRTIIFATHYLEEAEQFARRTVVMKQGRIVADAPTETLRVSLGARTVSATLPPGGAEALIAAVRSLGGVSDLRVDALRLTLHATDSDSVAATLLAAGARDLEVAAPTLETAFTTLTEN